MNTPDMEWEKGWKFKLQEMVAEYQHGRLALSCDVLEFVESLLTSRDTYWKERVYNVVSEWVMHNAKTIQHNNGETEYVEVRELLTLLDNLK